MMQLDTSGISDLDDAPQWKVAYLEVEHSGALFND